MVTDRVDLPEQLIDDSRDAGRAWQARLNSLRVSCDVGLRNEPTVDQQGVKSSSEPH
jgi:hypothetical protein